MPLNSFIFHLYQNKLGQHHFSLYSITVFSKCYSFVILILTQLVMLWLRHSICYDVQYCLLFKTNYLVMQGKRFNQIVNCLQIYGWRPEYYNDSSALPEKMPQSLKDFIKSEEVANKLSVSHVHAGETWLQLEPS